MSTTISQIRTRFTGGWELLMTAPNPPIFPGEMRVALKWPEGVLQHGPDANFDDAVAWATSQIESFQEWYARDGDLLD